MLAHIGLHFGPDLDQDGIRSEPNWGQMWASMGPRLGPNGGIHNVRHGYYSYRYEGSIVIGYRVCHRVVHGLIIRIPELWSTVFSFTALSTRVCTEVSTE
jgi:hypothetical protein